MTAAGGDEAFDSALTEAARTAGSTAGTNMVEGVALELGFNDDGVLVRRSTDGGARFMVPGRLRAAVCAHFHDDAGHTGWKASRARAERVCWWKGMQADFRHYVNSCDQCRSRRGPARGKHGAMGQLACPEENFEEWWLDCSGVIQRKGSGEKLVVFAAMCRRSKYTWKPWPSRGRAASTAAAHSTPSWGASCCGVDNPRAA